ncbi:Oligogalacturonate-specific porin protein KdgM [Shigella flexneri]|uniref:Oligogalacturonate-specific porin protein KdgM n=1 Tax=Shigella flexneri TaxID=623 RepID=A0A379ZE18_SHIFL|nr:Oligogalacturonate-specific porin protein KdgM [Shigella flexneri]SUI79978.1 Oligogalacturonate-specific porin protein KdgM [Shigella flexneri]
MSYQPGGLVLPDLSRRGYLSKNASSSNRFGLVNGDGLSKDSRCWCTFSRWRSSMDNAIACSSSLVIVCTWGNDSNLLIVFYVQIMPDDLVMQLHRF